MVKIFSLEIFPHAVCLHCKQQQQQQHSSHLQRQARCLKKLMRCLNGKMRRLRMKSSTGSSHTCQMWRNSGIVMATVMKQKITTRPVKMANCRTAGIWAERG